MEWSRVKPLTRSHREVADAASGQKWGLFSSSSPKYTLTHTPMKSQTQSNIKYLPQRYTSDNKSYYSSFVYSCFPAYLSPNKCVCLRMKMITFDSCFHAVPLTDKDHDDDAPVIPTFSGFLSPAEPSHVLPDGIAAPDLHLFHSLLRTRKTCSLSSQPPTKRLLSLDCHFKHDNMGEEKSEFVSSGFQSATSARKTPQETMTTSDDVIINMQKYMKGWRLLDFVITCTFGWAGWLVIIQVKIEVVTCLLPAIPLSRLLFVIWLPHASVIYQQVLCKAYL